MKYTRELHDFIQACQMKYGHTPNEWDHHVFIEADNRIGFAYFEDGVWITLLPYDLYSVSHLTSIMILLSRTIDEYEHDNPDMLTSVEDVPVAGSAIRMIRDSVSRGGIDPRGKIIKGPMDWRGDNDADSD